MAMILCNIAGNSRLFWSHELSSFFSLSFFAPKYGEGNDTKKMPQDRQKCQVSLTGSRQLTVGQIFPPNGGKKIFLSPFGDKIN